CRWRWGTAGNCCIPLRQAGWPCSGRRNGCRCRIEAICFRSCGRCRMDISMKKIIPVTRPLLPPLDEFVPYLERIWASGILTNGGDMHKALEKALCEYLGVPHVALFANGTLALVTAL